MKKTIEQLSDSFLSEIVFVLGINDFKFNRSTINTNVRINDNIKSRLKRLCACNKNDRIRYNEFNIQPKFNPHWSYEVLATYFNIDIN